MGLVVGFASERFWRYATLWHIIVPIRDVLEVRHTFWPLSLCGIDLRLLELAAQWIRANECSPIRRFQEILHRRRVVAEPLECLVLQGYFVPIAAAAAMGAPIQKVE